MRSEFQESNVKWPAAVAAILLAIAGIVHYLPGSGVQTRLNASGGINSPAFIASQKKALRRLSPGQVSVFTWAMGQLDADTFTKLYGTAPTLRDVASGEIMRAADVQWQIIRQGSAWLAKQPAKLVVQGQKMVDTEEALKAENYKLLKRYAPTITGVVRQRNQVGYFLEVNYTLNLPESLHAKTLPCAVVYHPRTVAMTNEVDFDCLYVPKIGNEYRLRLADVPGYDVADIDFRLDAAFDQIWFGQNAGGSASVEANAPPDLPWTAAENKGPVTPYDVKEGIFAVKTARVKMKYALDQKSEM